VTTTRKAPAKKAVAEQVQGSTVSEPAPDKHVVADLPAPAPLEPLPEEVDLEPATVEPVPAVTPNDPAMTIVGSLQKLMEQASVSAPASDEDEIPSLFDQERPPTPFDEDLEPVVRSARIQALRDRISRNEYGPTHNITKADLEAEIVRLGGQP
jgi:hypothetical protein